MTAGRRRQFAVDAGKMITLSGDLLSEHEMLVREGYKLNDRARCYPNKRGGFTLRLVWHKRNGRKIVASQSITISGIYPRTIEERADSSS